ncbi:hypothetical protein GCM10027403_00490 [Arthrobacter tecti]
MSEMAISKSALRGGALTVGLYAILLCWFGVAWMIVTIPGLFYSSAWFLAPAAVLTLVLCARWFKGRERAAPRKPRHVHVRRRHVARAVVVGAAQRGPRSPLSRSLLIVFVYTATLAWGLLVLMAWNGAAWVLGSVLLGLPLLATLLATFAWAYRGRPQT